MTTQNLSECESCCDRCAAAKKNGGESFFAAKRVAGGAVVFAGGLALNFFLPTFADLWARLIFALAYALIGGDILMLAFKNIRRGKVFDENFLMSVASLGAFAIGEYAEAVGVMLFYQIGEYFQELATGKAKREITALLDLRPAVANVQRGGEIISVPPEQIEIGETLLIRAGEKIPLDGLIVTGASALDNSALTGESLPREVASGDQVLSGAVNLTGALTLRVTKKYADSAVAQILKLTRQAADKKAPIENFFTAFAKYYTPAVVIGAALLAILPPLFGAGTFGVWLHRALIFLVISCPCALVVSIPLTFFAALGASARNGALVKGGNYLEALTQVAVAVFDKTGTLTRGKFKVSAIFPRENFSADEILSYAAAVECHSPHPLATAIREEFFARFAETKIAPARDYREIAGRGATAIVRGKKTLIGNAALMRENQLEISGDPAGENSVNPAKDFSSGAKIFIAIDRRLAGEILLDDQLKPDARAAVAELKKLGVASVAMLTGDHHREAAKIAETLALDEFRAELLPSEKHAAIETFIANARRKNAGKILFAGDGINDAPALARADIGVAMGKIGADAAIAQADIVVMRDELCALPNAIKIARRAKKIAWQNVGLSLGIKGAIMILGVIGVASMWTAIFADVGVALLAILNATRAGKTRLA